MRLLSSLFLLMICLGCKKENHPKIEIYLLKHPVESTEGVLFRETEQYKKLDSRDQEWNKHLRIDTIAQKLIFGGRFQATSADLSDYPFIKDDEIMGFNPDKDIFVFDSVVKRRIEYLFPGKHNVQFAITVDKSPVLTGYYWSPFSSQSPNTYNFYGMNIYNLKERDTTEVNCVLEFGPAKFIKREQKIRPPYSKKLIDAFKDSGRLRK